MSNLQPGQMLGPYRIINQIGQGGMAAVYKAYQPSMDRNVAIKVLPGQLAESKEFAARFRQEAHIIAKLEHPHILPVFDYGESDGTSYFVMRYLEAGTLKTKMEAGPLSLNETDHFFEQLAEALGYAHRHGVVHRDLKPGNALVDEAGNLFLTDFGIAKILESASPRLTQTDAIMGTPAYISPEQAKAMPVDQRSDIYSLGIILYEMVTGRVPFVADTPLAVILKHISDPLPPPSIIRSDIPDSIEHVILKALAKEPGDRYATAAEFLDAWKRALDSDKTFRYAPEKMPLPASHAGTAVITPKTSPASGISTGWVIGCIVLACLLISVGGIVVFGPQVLSLISQATETPIPPPTEVIIPPTEVPLPTVDTTLVLEDDFTEGVSDWGTGTDSDSGVEYVNNALNMVVFTKNYFVWSTPNEESYENVHMEVTALNNGTDSNSAFGFICDHQGSDASFYYLAITPGGQYAIVLASDGRDDVYLTDSDPWASSALLKVDAPSYRIGADCGNGTLSLYIDGQLIASVKDGTYTRGGVGLFTWSDVDAVTTNVTFDDFVLTKIK